MSGNRWLRETEGVWVKLWALRWGWGNEIRVGNLVAEMMEQISLSVVAPWYTYKIEKIEINQELQDYGDATQYKKCNRDQEMQDTR